MLASLFFFFFFLLADPPLDCSSWSKLSIRLSLYLFLISSRNYLARPTCLIPDCSKDEKVKSCKNASSPPFFNAMSRSSFMSLSVEPLPEK
jgi:hypothetical protein